MVPKASCGPQRLAVIVQNFAKQMSSFANQTQRVVFLLGWEDVSSRKMQKLFASKVCCLSETKM